VCDVLVVLAARPHCSLRSLHKVFILVSVTDYGLKLLQVQTLRKFMLQLTLLIRLYFFSEDGSDSEKSVIGNVFPTILKGKI
jgi:hypothetical protein